MNTDRLHTDFAHLSEEDIYRLLEGTFAPDEQKQREAHLKDCAFCSDMLEGFELAGGVRAFRKDVEALRAAIREKTQTRKKKIILFDQPFSVRTTVALAASILAAVALSMFLFLKKEDFTPAREISLNKEKRSDVETTQPSLEEVAPSTSDGPVAAEKSGEADKIAEPAPIQSERVQPLGYLSREEKNRDAKDGVSLEETPSETQKTSPSGVYHNTEINKSSAEIYEDYRSEPDAVADKKAESESIVGATAVAPKAVPAETPQPEGGYEAFVRYLESELASIATGFGNESKMKRERTVSGKQRASEAIGRKMYFYVEPDGQLTDFEITGETDKQRITEIIETIRKGPTWKPAYKDGKPVRQRVSVPLEY